MDVEDAVMPPTEEEDGSSDINTENGGRITCNVARHLKLGTTDDKKDDPPEIDDKFSVSDVVVKTTEEERDVTESNLSGTPIKLIMSGTDEEEEEEISENLSTLRKEGKVGKRRQLQITREEKEHMQLLKRKRYVVRRSGSDDCLLGFDEQSGEAELVKNEDTILMSFEDDRLSSTEGIQTTAIHKKTTKLKSLGKELVSMLPEGGMHIVDKIDISPVKDKKSEMNKQHIVGDNEENSGDMPKTTHLDIRANSSIVSAPGNTVSKKPHSAKDDFYKKPFEYGWKRELVWRANIETSKDKADVYFITPGGKKLRTRSDIAPLLEGDLTLDHFCFAREPLGVGPDLETVRSAKPSSRASITAATLAAASTPTNIGKRVSKPKGPKGASPPPQGWTPTRALKVNNAALMGSTNSSRYGLYTSNYSTPNANRSGTTGSTSRSVKPKKASVNRELSASTVAGNISDPCTVACTRAAGQVPQLQCTKCLCLFHHECIGLNRLDCDYRGTSNTTKNDRSYICEACSPITDSTIKATTSNPATSIDSRSESKLPQSITVVKGKKYVMIAKPLAAPSVHANDIENDLKQINESIRNNCKPNLPNLDSVLQQHNSSANSLVDYSSKLFATNFFANVSFAYDALLCILKYLKIHERARAASVCKLWYLAAKDTSLWHTVRMKNSKVCNWAGFAAALRRGETKHLDLHKILPAANPRGDEMWQEFSNYIGIVGSLETIDLCRCPARVVESLCLSNKNLRIFNAVSINDDGINIEHFGLMKNLVELRLRTSEPGVLVGDLQPLQKLTELTHLSLTAIRGLGGKCIEVLGELTSLRALELGECGDFDSTFSDAVLPKLAYLQRLRLENGQETGCCTLEILDSVARLEKLSQLELVNFDIKPGFDEKLRQCTNIRKLLIIPTYISQSATTNHIVLSAVQQVSDTLHVFTWGVTVELLRVTALYVDQCEESAKKEKHHFDECIPVLKPVPGASSVADDDDAESDAIKESDEENGANEVPQIEILPLDKIESILRGNLPHTKFTIVKVSYHLTCKQQLVE